MSEHIKTNDNAIRKLTGEYKRIETNRRESERERWNDRHMGIAGTVSLDFVVNIFNVVLYLFLKQQIGICG